jgi:hypothetical protein
LPECCHDFGVKLALHRSITFWSGILVMGFIGWAWCTSYRYGSSAGFGRYSVEQAVGGINIVRNWDSWGGSGFRFYHDPLRPGRFDEELLPSPFYLEGKGKSLPPRFRRPVKVREWLECMGQSAGSFGLFLPHWLLLLAVALPWSGLLLWRARRRGRAAAISA